MVPEKEEAAPNPAPYKSQRSLPLSVPLLFVPVPCPPVFEPLVYCDESTGPFGAELLLPLMDEPVPDPEPPRSTGPFGAELLLPLVDEPAPDPVPQKSTGPVDWEPPVPAVEPSVGLPPVRTIPGGEETPGSKTAVIDPKPLRESCPNPASIARFSRDSITVHSVEVRGGRYVVFRRLTGLLLGRPLRRGHIAALTLHRRKGFYFRQGIGSRWDFPGRRRGSNPRGNPGKGLFSGL